MRSDHRSRLYVPAVDAKRQSHHTADSRKRMRLRRWPKDRLHQIFRFSAACKNADSPGFGRRRRGLGSLAAPPMATVSGAMAKRRGCIIGLFFPAESRAIRQTSIASSAGARSPHPMQLHRVIRRTFIDRFGSQRPPQPTREMPRDRSPKSDFRSTTPRPPTPPPRPASAIGHRPSRWAKPFADHAL